MLEPSASDDLLAVEPLHVAVRQQALGRRSIVVGTEARGCRRLRRRRQCRGITRFDGFGRRQGQGSLGRVQRGRFRRGRGSSDGLRLGAVHAPVGEGHVHAEARSDLDQQRHEQRQRRLHLLHLDAGHLRKHGGLRIGFGHHGAAGSLRELAADVGDARLELLRFAPGGQLRRELVELLAVFARRLACDFRALLRQSASAAGPCAH